MDNPVKHIPCPCSQLPLYTLPNSWLWLTLDLYSSYAHPFEEFWVASRQADKYLNKTVCMADNLQHGRVSQVFDATVPGLALSLVIGGQLLPGAT